MEQLSSFSKLAPYLSNPLVLIGFVLLLAFGVHRALIRSGLLPQVSQGQSSTIVKLILKYGFMISCAILVLGFGYVYYTSYLSHAAEMRKSAAKAELERLQASARAELERQQAAAKAELESRIVLSTKKTELTIVDLVVGDLIFDFKLKNSGTDTAFLTEVRFLFYPGTGVPSTCMPIYTTLYEFPFSAELAGQLVAISEGEKLPDKNSGAGTFKPQPYEHPVLRSPPLKISQAVPPGGVDRFTVRFVIDSKYKNRFFVDDRCRWSEAYEGHAEITYDGKRTLTSPRFRITYVPSEHRDRGDSEKQTKKGT